MGDTWPPITHDTVLIHGHQLSKSQVCVACAARFPNTSWLLSESVLTLMENPDWAGIVAESVTRSDCAEAVVADADVVEVAGEVVVAGELDIAEVLDDADELNVKTVLLEPAVALLLELVVEVVLLIMDTPAAEDEAMAEVIELLPVPTKLAAMTL
jgi:hypothetical protein